MKKDDELQKRLEDWAVWKREIEHHVGWNVKVIHEEEPVNYQKRNDTHSNPVLDEVKRIDYEQWRIQTTNAAYCELLPKLRDVIYARYVKYPDVREMSDTRLADKMKIRREVFRERHETALDQMEQTIKGIIRSWKMVC